MTTPIELKRHYRRLSPKETDEVVSAVADLIVNFLKGQHKTAIPSRGKTEDSAPPTAPIVKKGIEPTRRRDG